MPDLFIAPLELKFLDSGQPGEFEGYGAVFGNVDSHGDVIAPGAFTKTLADHAAQGTMPYLHATHDWAFGGDPLPSGVWTSLAEDDKGLVAKGKISGLDTDHGKRVYSLMKDGALNGLSIGFNVPPGGSEKGKKAGEPKRTIKQIDLHSLDIVKRPSNAEARVMNVKGLFASADKDLATEAVARAIGIHRATMSKGDSPTADEGDAMLNHLQDAHEALTGQRMPPGMKNAPQTIRELEALLRESGLSHAQARAIAERGFKGSDEPRDEGRGQADSPADLDELSKLLGGFTLPKFTGSK